MCRLAIARGSCMGRVGWMVGTNTQRGFGVGIWRGTGERGVCFLFNCVLSVRCLPHPLPSNILFLSLKKGGDLGPFAESPL